MAELTPCTIKDWATINRHENPIDMRKLSVCKSHICDRMNLDLWSCLMSCVNKTMLEEIEWVRKVSRNCFKCIVDFTSSMIGTRDSDGCVDECTDMSMPKTSKKCEECSMRLRISLDECTSPNYVPRKSK